MKTITRYRRGAFGHLCRWSFIGFNVLMALWLIGGIFSASEVADQYSGPNAEAAAAGVAIGMTMGVMVILFIWATGALILGMLSYFTRGEAVTETIE
jgi:hypothetical protein